MRSCSTWRILRVLLLLCHTAHTSAQTCNTGYVGGNLTAPYPASACDRFIALIPKPSFASVSTRLNDAVGNLPTYSAAGGPSGKGHVSFARASSQYLNAGARTFNVATNGGFTIVAVVRFTGTVGSYETIIDLGSNKPSNNIMLQRESTTSELSLYVYNAATLSARKQTTQNSQAQGNLVQNSWLTIVCTYRVSPSVSVLSVNGISFSVDIYSAITDRTVSATYVGRSWWPNDAYPNYDIAGLFFVDEYLSTDVTTAIVNTIANGVDMTDTKCSCTPCNAGYTGPDGGPCSACVAGKYKIVIGSVSCIDCPAGTYSNSTGATSCSTCPSNTVSASTSSSTFCVCIKGYAP
jgi:hypothetical protein